MDPRTLQEVDETGADVRLVLPYGYPAALEFEWRDDDGALIDLTGWTGWGAWIKRTPGADERLDFTPDATDQAASIIRLTLTAPDVNTAHGYGPRAVWSHFATDPAGTLRELMAGPVVIRR